MADETKTDIPATPLDAPTLPPDTTRTKFARRSDTVIPSEVATLLVNNLRFEDWDTIWIQETWGDWFAQFRFTCADAVNVPFTAPSRAWQLLQFKPNDRCKIFLGGEQVMYGVIQSRQAAYDARQHGVQLMGVGLSWLAARSSILDEKSRYEGSFLDIADKVLAPTGVQRDVVGEISSKPFEPAAAPKPGETISAFLERLSRDRNISIGSDRFGRVVFIGGHTAALVARLIEGENILKCQCRITNDGLYSLFVTRGQSAGGDQLFMRKAAEQEADAPGALPMYSVLLTPMEHPVWTEDEVVLRNSHEVRWSQGQYLEATITVQGWFTPKGTTWRVGWNVAVFSRMAMLDMVMKIQTVTFQQSRREGSTTTLLCVAPWKFRDRIPTAIGQTPPPMEPLPSQANTGPATTPKPDPARTPKPGDITKPIFP